MNPQYMSQQFPPPPQGRPPTSLTPQGSFQSVPLGQPKPANQTQNGPMHMANPGPPNAFGAPPGSFPSPGPPHMNQFSQLPGQMPPNRPPLSQLPPTPLPPGLQNPPSQQMPPSAPSNQFGSVSPMPIQQKNASLVQNGPPGTQINGTPGQFQQNSSFGPPPPSVQQMPPGQSMPGQPPLGGPPPGTHQPSAPNMPPLSTPQQMRAMPPPMPQQGGIPTSLSGQSSMPVQNQPPPAGHTPIIRQPPIPTQNQAPSPGQPPLSAQPMQSPPSMSGPPSMLGPSNIPGQPPLPGQMKSPNSMATPSLPSQNQFGGPPFQNRPPVPGQMNNQFGQPGIPRSDQMGQPPNQFNQPPLPGQQYPPSSQGQLANQIQNMNIGGPRQYPGGPNKAFNGDGPHMPPPLSQQSYVNGQQMRSPQSPGYPPMPGQGQISGPGGYNQPYQSNQPQRRLDPDQMPSPIQVMQDDQANRSGEFLTSQKGLGPPLVTTKFIVNDQGNCSPRLARSTMYNIPITQDLMKQTSVPFGLVISPMARTADQEYPPPIVNFGTLGPVRCIRCKAYMCPYMQFIDSGKRFQCPFCKAATDVPAEYFQHLDHTGQRMDRFERPELVLGTYEFTATTDYCRNNTLPKSPAVIFLIDVSYNNIKSGLVHLLCSQMKSIIQNLPVDQGQEKSNMKVGFITYNSTVHFYNIKGTLAAPQMLVVGDTQEMFMPLLDGFLCTPEESEAVIDSLMEQIPNMFADTRETETILLPAILAGLEALKASECAGKLLVFHSTLPIAEAPGKLKNRDDRKLLGTEKERTVLTPQTQAYNQLGQDCVGVGCSVDLFIFNNAYIDVATIGQVSRLSGGEVYKYTYFQADSDGERLVQDIITNISRPIGFDAIMRVRTSTGVRATDFYGHFFMSNTTDIELASIDCDKAVAVEIKHDDKLTEDDGVYVQVALLYTSCSGERRLRIMNLALKTCSQMNDLYRSCDLDTLINFFSKQTVYKLLENNPKAVKDAMIARAAQILANYRKNCASPSSAGQLILPECMKLLPLYLNCLINSDAVSGGPDITLDDRSFVMQAVMTMDIPSSVSYFYPRLIPVHDIKATVDGKIDLPSPIRCTVEKMHDQGVYILENGIHMFLWIGLNANPEFVQQVFGVPSALQIDIERVSLPILENPMSIAVRSIIEQIREQRHRCMRLTMVRQREKLEPVFKQFLVEDRGQDGSPSYVDFLCHMHKEIRNLLS